MAGIASFLVRLSLEVIREYDFSVPLHRYLASWLRERKKLGSRDRRGIRELVYSYYRLGRALPELDSEKRLSVALYLTQQQPVGWMEEFLLASGFSANRQPNVQERVKQVQYLFPEFKVTDLFPFDAELSKGVDADLLRLSALEQPCVWIRIRREFLEAVREEFNDKGLNPLLEYSPYSLGFTSATDLESTQSFEKGFFEIQDLASQLTADLYQAKSAENWWDCCAASGGKSLLMLDKYPVSNLTVSDVRNTSLINLKERFRRNRYPQPESFVVNLENSISIFPEDRMFDGILADVPCSGSGTWSRTPEMLSAFEQKSLADLQQLQMRIVSNAVRHLKTGGKLIYMTCSVFKQENEAVVDHLLGTGTFHLEEMKLLQMTSLKADTLFAARLTRIK